VSPAIPTTAAAAATAAVALLAVNGDSSIVSTVLSLGSASAAVFMAVLFLKFIQDYTKTQREQQAMMESRQSEMYTRLFEEMRQLAMEKGAVLAKTADSMRENTEVTRHLEKSIDALGVIIRELGIRARETARGAGEVARDARQTAEMLQKVVQAAPPSSTDLRTDQIRGEA
jgi:hypothetical protein